MDVVPDGKTIRAGSTTYFLDLKESAKGDSYLLITGSIIHGDDKKRERSSIRLFPENAEEFLVALQGMAKKLKSRVGLSAPCSSAKE